MLVFLSELCTLISRFLLFFKYQKVDDLMSTLGKTRSNFIRCIKPNTDKRPLYFQGAQTHEQLRCSGVFEAVTIRRQGYPSRLAHASFYRRYKTLASLSPDQSPLQALAMEPDAPAVPKVTKIMFGSVLELSSHSTLHSSVHACYSCSHFLP